MNSLSLFSGAGGGLLAEKYLLNWRSIGYVENNVYCQKVLAQRIKEGFLELAPLWGDIDEFIESGAVDQYKGLTDVVTGGFPCQPFSVAGRRKGKDDSRNCWPQTIEVIRRVRPRWFFGENVSGLLNSGYFPEILGSLAEAGYDARWIVLGADDVGAPHRRKRLWILAYPPGELSYGSHDNARVKLEREKTSKSGNSGWTRDVAYPNNQRSHGIKSDDSLSKVERREPSIRSEDRFISKMGSPDHKGSGDVADSKHLGQPSAEITGSIVAGSDSGASRTETTGEPPRRGEQYAHVADSFSERGRLRETDRKDAENVGQSPRRSEHGYWNTEPDVGRVAHGVASRVDRLKAIGNGQVPLVAATAWKLLSG